MVRTRPYFILLNPGDQNPRTAYNIAERLNSIFHATVEPNLKVGEAKTRELILTNVPAAYRHNHYRFLLVARQVPILPTPPDSAFRRRMEDELLDPQTTLTAAVKLEALGVSSTRALRVGLESTSPWVRFAAAEALTYLGQTDGAVELGRLAEDHPALRAPALKALASMDDAACTDRLAELMAANDSVLRYGAFIALRLADENNPAVRGLKVNESFYLHRVAPGSPGLIHLTSDRRCEIVLFGDNVRFRGPFTLPVGADFTVHVPGGGEEATITRIVKVKGDLEEKKLSCPPDVSAVLSAICSTGGAYNEAVELTRRADRAQVISTTLVQHAIPAELNASGSARPVRPPRPDAGEGQRGGGEDRRRAAGTGCRRIQSAAGLLRPGDELHAPAAAAAAQSRARPHLRAQAPRRARHRPGRRAGRRAIVGGGRRGD